MRQTKQIRDYCSILQVFKPRYSKRFLNLYIDSLKRIELKLLSKIGADFPFPGMHSEVMACLFYFRRECWWHWKLINEALFPRLSSNLHFINETNSLEKWVPSVKKQRLCLGITWFLVSEILKMKNPAVFFFQAR